MPDGCDNVLKIRFFMLFCSASYGQCAESFGGPAIEYIAKCLRMARFLTANPTKTIDDYGGGVANVRNARHRQMHAAPLLLAQIHRRHQLQHPFHHLHIQHERNASSSSCLRLGGIDNAWCVLWSRYLYQINLFMVLPQCLYIATHAFYHE